MTFTRAGLRMSAGPLCWALHFAAIYGFTGLACARGMADAVPVAVAAFTLVAGGAAAAVLWLSLRRRESFEHWLAAALAAAALLAIAWEALPALLVPACA
jgi:hypothetical protein